MKLVSLYKLLLLSFINGIGFFIVYMLWMHYFYLFESPVDKPVVYEYKLDKKNYNGYYKFEPGTYNNNIYKISFTINSLGFRQ